MKFGMGVSPNDISGNCIKVERSRKATSLSTTSVALSAGVNSQALA